MLVTRRDSHWLCVTRSFRRPGLGSGATPAMCAPKLRIFVVSEGRLFATASGNA